MMNAGKKVLINNKEAIYQTAYDNKDVIAEAAYDNRDVIAQAAYNNRELLAEQYNKQNQNKIRISKFRK